MKKSLLNYTVASEYDYGGAEFYLLNIQNSLKIFLPLLWVSIINYLKNHPCNREEYLFINSLISYLLKPRAIYNYSLIQNNLPAEKLDKLLFHILPVFFRCFQKLKLEI
jgi:hypothetical protein